MSIGGQGVEIIPPLEQGKSRDQAGKLLGVSGKYISDAKAIAEKAPEIFQNKTRFPILEAGFL